MPTPAERTGDFSGLGVHLLNLVPVRRTDGAVALHAGCAGLVRRWDLERAQLETAQKEGATGGQ